MDVVSSVAAVVGLVFNFATAIKTCNDIRGRYKDAEKTIGSIRHELETLQGALQELANIMMNDASALTSRWDTTKTLPRTFERAVRGFKRTIKALQDDMEPLQSNIRLGKMDKVKFLWNEDGMKEHLGQLRAQSSALQLLLMVLHTSSISDVKNNLNNVEAALIQLSMSSNNSREEDAALPAYRHEAGPVHILDHEEDLLDLDWSVVTPTRATPSLQRPLEDMADTESKSKSPPRVTREDVTNRIGDEGPSTEAPSSIDTPTELPVVEVNSTSPAIDVTKVRGSELTESDSLIPGNVESQDTFTTISPGSIEVVKNSTPSTTQNYDPRSSPPALIRAVYRGDIEGVKQLLAAGNDIEVSHPTNGRTAAIVAAFLGDSTILQVLLDHGASVTAIDRLMRTPLHYAASEGWLACVELLLSRGAPTDLMEHTMNDIPLHCAIRHGNEDVLRTLLVQTPDPLQHSDLFHHNILHLAARYWGSRKPCMVSLILEHIRTTEHLQDCSNVACIEASFSAACNCPTVYPRIDEADYLGHTATQIAMNTGDAALLLLLLQISPSEVNSPRRILRRPGNVSGLPNPVFSWERPLHFAIRYNRLELFNILLEAGADTNLPNSAGQTPLACAVYYKDEQAFKALLAHGAHYMAICSEHPTQTLLEEALQTFSHTILDALVASRPELDFSTSKDAVFVLRQSQIHGRWETVRTLLRQCTQKNKIGRILDDQETLHYALRSSMPEMVEFLLQSGADIGISTQYQNSSGLPRRWQPIHAIASYARLDMVDVLLRNGANILAEAENGHSWLPLHYATRSADMNTILYFVSKTMKSMDNDTRYSGREISFRDTDIFKKSLKIACKRNSLEIVKHFIEPGEMDGDRVVKGALRVSVQFGRREVTEYLLATCTFSLQALNFAQKVKFERLEDDLNRPGNNSADHEACKLLVSREIDERNSRKSRRKGKD